MKHPSAPMFASTLICSFVSGINFTTTLASISERTFSFAQPPKNDNTFPPYYKSKKIAMNLLIYEQW